jgi:hypothetical protein
MERGHVMYVISFIAILAIVLAALAAFDDAATVDLSDFSVSCIDGVEYWYGQSGYKGYMSPRIDSGTLDFVRCE